MYREREYSVVAEDTNPIRSVRVHTTLSSSAPLFSCTHLHDRKEHRSDEVRKYLSEASQRSWSFSAWLLLQQFLFSLPLLHLHRLSSNLLRHHLPSCWMLRRFRKRPFLLLPWRLQHRLYLLLLSCYNYDTELDSLLAVSVYDSEASLYAGSIDPVLSNRNISCGRSLGTATGITTGTTTALFSFVEDGKPTEKTETRFMQKL
jgi:hypothetical protein